MALLTKDLVFAYTLGGVTDPDLRRRIEAARESDPLARYWFDLFSDDGIETPSAEWLGRADRQETLFGVLVDPPGPPVVPARWDRGRAADRFTIKETVLLGAWSDAAPPPFPASPPPPDLPLREVDVVARRVRLLYPPEWIPYGVAWVVASAGGAETHRQLVPFAAAEEGGVPVRRAVLGFTELGIPDRGSPAMEFDVVPATDRNLDRFPVGEVDALFRRVATNIPAAVAVKALLARLEREGRP